MRFGELGILESFLLVVGVKWRPCWETIQKSVNDCSNYRSSGLEILSAELHFHAASLSNKFEFMFIVWYILLNGPQFGSVSCFLMIRFRVCIFVRKAVEVMLWSSPCILPGGTQCWYVCPVTGDINCDHLGWFLPISVGDFLWNCANISFLIILSPVNCLPIDDLCLSGICQMVNFLIPSLILLLVGILP